MNATIAKLHDRTLRVSEAAFATKLAGVSALVAFYYFMILTDGHFDPSQPVPLGTTFNSMLHHLLHWQFDVDPDAVRFEGFARDGKVYSYWGIFCALLRLQLLLIPDGLSRDVTLLSCLVAATSGTMLKLLSLRLVARRVPSILLLTAAVYIVSAGQYFGYLKGTIYEEVLLWASAITSAFLLIALHGLVRNRFTTAMLLGMAVLAGLGLLTRVTFGIGLYGSLGLLLIKLAIDRREATAWAGVIGAGSILLAFAAATGVVNLHRWGSPLVFMDNSGYALNGLYPDRRIRELLYGAFNAQRIPYSLDYYFGLLWTLRDGGTFLFQAAHSRLYDVIELPQSSFLLTDLFAFACFGTGMWAARRQLGNAQWLTVAALMAGFGVQSLLILCAISTAYRYRQDFYPLFDVLLFIGLLLLARSQVSRRRLLVAALGCCMMVSVSATHVSLGLYKLSPLGMYWLSAPGALSDYYAERLHDRLPRLFH